METNESNVKPTTIHPILNGSDCDGWILRTEDDDIDTIATVFILNFRTLRFQVIDEFYKSRSVVFDFDIRDLRKSDRDFYEVVVEDLEFFDKAEWADHLKELQRK